MRLAWLTRRPEPHRTAQAAAVVLVCFHSVQTSKGRLFATPNVRAKLPAEAGAVSLVRDDAPCAAD